VIIINLFAVFLIPGMETYAENARQLVPFSMTL